MSSWEKAFFYFAKEARHNEAKTVIHYLEALEYLWMAVNSHQYCQTGLSFDQAQMVCIFKNNNNIDIPFYLIYNIKHPFWQWVTRTISSQRGEWHRSRQAKNSYLIDSGILHQVLPSMRYY